MFPLNIIQIQHFTYIVQNIKRSKYRSKYKENTRYCLSCNSTKLGRITYILAKLRLYFDESDTRQYHLFKRLHLLLIETCT